jgi:hypothetical protein
MSCMHVFTCTCMYIRPARDLLTGKAIINLQSKNIICASFDVECVFERHIN